MEAPLRILILDDSEDDAALLLYELKRGGYHFTYERVWNEAGLRAALAGGTWDIALSDFSMPPFSGPQALKILQELELDLPFIIVSGTIDETRAVDALRAGAHDFIVKGNFARLGPAIDRELREARSRRARRQAEQRLATAMDSMSEGAQIIGFDWTYLYVNNAAAAQNRKTREDMVGQKLAAVHPDFEQSALYGTLRRSLEQRVAQVSDEERTYSDGTHAWFTLNLEPVPDGLFILSQDITERKRAESQIQDQLARLAALRKIDRAINGSLDLQVTLEVFLSQVVAQLGISAADVLMLDPQSQLLEFAAGQGFHGYEFQKLRTRIGEGRAGQVVQERQIVTASRRDVRAASRRTGLLNSEGFESYYGVPLVAKGQIVGVLEIFHRQPLHPTSEWLEFLEALAGQAAIAIDNARLFNSLQDSNQELITAYAATILGWSRALDLRDRETEGHSQRVTELTTELARTMGLTAPELVHIRRGALLHDIGKMGIPDHILLKPGPLTDEEWVTMRRHPALAHEMLQPIRYLRPALDIPYCHHEWWDGSGYPRQLQGNAIPLAARMFAVVDVWDALRSNRPYRSAWPAERVREIIRQDSGTHFDPAVVDVFLQMDFSDDR